MKKYGKYILVCLIGFFIAKWMYRNEKKTQINEDIQIVTQSIKNVQKLVVSEGYFNEMYNYKDAKKYFYDTFEFEKSAIVSVNAKVQVQFDLAKMVVEIDSVEKRIVIKKIPKEEIEIYPEVKYFDLQQSTFNTFDKETLNRIQEKSIAKIKETAKVSRLQKNAKEQLLRELSKIYQLSAILGWEVVDETEGTLLENIFTESYKD